jgi:hypothetical protein
MAATQDHLWEKARAKSKKITSLFKSSSSSVRNYGELYQYRPLTHGKRIRLLYLQPGSDDDPLRGTLEDVDINSGAEYSAISYAWGSSEKPQQIELEPGIYTPLTLSLFTALRDLRSLKTELGSLVFWADQLCINQTDIVERGAQVDLMNQIYSKAKRVITYSGPGDADEYGAFEVAQKVTAFAKSRPDEPAPLYGEEHFIEAGIIEKNDARWAALRRILAYEWPGRSWILQESVLNDNTILVCGKRIYDWDILPKLASLVLEEVKIDTEALRLNHSQSLSHFRRIGKLRWKILRTRRSKLPLLDLLSLGHKFNATDPRDKVYALLGLAVDRDLLELQPDYETEPSLVFLQTALRIIEVGRNLDIFSWASPHRESVTPFWVPDWSQNTREAPTPLLITTTSKSVYRASLQSTPELETTNGGATLILAGGILDRVKHSWSLYSLLKEDDYSLLNSLVQRACLLSRYEVRSDAELAFATTLVAGLDFENEETTSEVSEWMRAILRLDETYSGNILAASAARDVDCTPAFKFLKALGPVSRRSLAITAQGYLCLAPVDTKDGDCVAVLLGGKTPYILRPDGEEYRFLGESYVYGIMKGEVMSDPNFMSSLEKIKII